MEYICERCDKYWSTAVNLATGLCPNCGGDLYRFDQPQDGPEPTKLTDEELLIMGMFGPSDMTGDELENILSEIKASRARIAALEAESAELSARYDACAEKLAAARHEAADADERVKEAVADCAAMFVEMEKICLCEASTPNPEFSEYWCLFCGAQGKQEHNADCILISPHPGAPLLAELAALKAEVLELSCRPQATQFSELDSRWQALVKDHQLTRNENAALRLEVASLRARMRMIAIGGMSA